MYKDFQRLMAQTYDNSNNISDSEINYWNKLATEAEGPILELGSGTGRVLIPLLEKGYDISGLENSHDMIEVCKQKCIDKNLSNIEIYEMSMLNFKIKKLFNLIILPSGSLSLFTKDDEVKSLFVSVYDHLNTSGLFVFEVMKIPNEKKQWKSSNIWTGNWFEDDEGTIITQRKLMKYNKETHCWKCPAIYEKYKNGKLVDSELNMRVGRLFNQDEIEKLLAESGFTDINAYNLMSYDPVTESSLDFTFVCRK